MKLSKKHLSLIFSLCSFAVFLFIFRAIIHRSVSTDIQSHASHLLYYLKHNLLPTPPLYYLVLHMVSGFSDNLWSVYRASIFILAISTTLKFWVSSRIFFINTKQEHNIYSSVLVLIILSCLMFVTPILYDFKGKIFLLGRLGTTIWHNSTHIFAMPFVMLLFHESWKFIENPQISRKSIFYMMLWGVLQVLIKPSFLFAFAPAFPLVLLIKYGLKSKKLWLGVGVVATLCVLIFIEYYVIYKLDFYAQIYNIPKSGIGISPFRVWGHYSKNVPLDALVSLLFPLVCLLFCLKGLKQNYFLQYGFFLALFAIAIFILVIETGRRTLHGNFGWQMLMCNYVLFFVCTLVAYKRIKEWGYMHIKSILLIVVFMCHSLSGVLYVHKMLTIRNFF